MELLLIKHGLLMSVVGILAGLPFLKSINKGNEEQWRIAHLAGILGGVFLIALSLAYKHFTLDAELNRLVALFMIISNWLFTFGMIISGVSGKRGLSPKSKSIAGKAIFVMYSIAALLSTLGTIGLLVIGLQL